MKNKQELKIQEALVSACLFAHFEKKNLESKIPWISFFPVDFRG